MNKQEVKRALDYLSKMTPKQRAELIDDLSRPLKSGNTRWGEGAFPRNEKFEIEARQTYAKLIDLALSMTAEKAISKFSRFLNQVYQEVNKKEKREQTAESKRATEARATEMARAVNAAMRKQGKQP